MYGKYVQERKVTTINTGYICQKLNNRGKDGEEGGR